MKPFKQYILYQCDLFNKLILNKSYSGKCRWYQTNSPMRHSRYWTILFAQAVLPLLLLLVFTGSKAQILYARAFGTASWDTADDIIVGSDSNYVMLGSQYKNLYISKADTIGQLIWEKSYPTDSILLYPSSICEIGDSSYVMAGKYQNVGFLLKVNTIGDSLFSLNDSTFLGTNVTNLRQAPDGNLLALVSRNGIVSLVKFDDNLNVINTINNIVPAIKGIEVVNSKIYILKQDSINNLLIIDDDFSQIDTVTMSIKIPDLLRVSFNKNQLMSYGRDSSGLYIPHKMIVSDLLGSTIRNCDSIPILYTSDISDFKQIDLSSNMIFSSAYYNATWGIDIRLYFTDNCGQIVHDTILYRGGTMGDPWREEWVVKVLIDHNGNYVLFGRAEKGPLGDWDILFWIYKKWDGFPTSVEETANDKLGIENTITIYPNPTQNQFIVSGITENSNITVMDVMGKVVYYIPNIIYQTQISTTNWAKGLYIVQLKGNTATTSLKVVKQ